MEKKFREILSLKPALKRLLARVGGLKSALCAVILLLLLSGCSRPTKFTVEGEIEGIGTQNLNLIYRDGGNVRSGLTTAINSKFSFEGSAEEPAVVEIFSSKRAPIGKFVAKNGDKIKLHLKASDPLSLEAEGNKTSEELAAFLSRCTTEDLNERIAEEVTARPGELLSSVLMGYYYEPWGDPELADSLLGIVEASGTVAYMTADLREAVRRAQGSDCRIGKLTLRCRIDSVTQFSPASTGLTLYLFDDENRLADEVADTIKALDNKRLAIAYIRLGSDTIGWHPSTKKLPKEAMSLWAPGALANRELEMFNLPSTKYFIVTDSMGQQLFRGETAAACAAFLREKE